MASTPQTDVLALLGGATGRVLAAAISSPYPLRSPELATAAGVSRFAGSRAAATLLDARLLRPGGIARTVEVNPDHPFATAIQDLLWTTLGAKAPQAQRSLDTTLLHRVTGALPAALDTDPRPTVTVPTGVSMVTARKTIDQIDDLVAGLLEIERWAQSVFSAWYDERLRDVVHLTMHLGVLARMATYCLEQATLMTQQGDLAADEAAVHPATWGAAAWLLNGEALVLEDLTRLFEDSATRGRQIRGARADALLELSRDAVRKPGKHVAGDPELEEFEQEYRRSRVEHALRQVRAADAAFEDAGRHTKGRRAMHHTGGMPGIEEFGSNGDMILAVVCRDLLEHCVAIVEPMREQPCWQPWFDTQAEAAKARFATVPPEPSTRREPQPLVEEFADDPRITSGAIG